MDDLTVNVACNSCRAGADPGLPNRGGRKRLWTVKRASQGTKREVLYDLGLEASLSALEA